MDSDRSKDLLTENFELLTASLRTVINTTTNIMDSIGHETLVDAYLRHYFIYFLEYFLFILLPFTLCFILRYNFHGFN